MEDKNIVTKKQSEYFPITVDFTNVLGTSETLTISSSVIPFNSGSIQLSGSEILKISATTYANSYLQGFVQSGSLNSQYKLEFKAVTSDGNVYSENVYVLVKD